MHNPGMGDWNDLRYCLHVVREGSTLAAARLLDVSQTTVMRRIAALEAELGFELFEKRRNGYVPTQALREILPRLEAVEAAHADFEREAGQMRRGLKGTVRLTAPELLVTYMLSDALIEFARLYPEIKIELFTTDRHLDLTRGEADIAVRAGLPPREPSLFGRRLIASDSWSICCSRSYAERHGIPCSKDDLKQHTAISLLDNGISTPVTEWFRQHVPEERIAFRHNTMVATFMSMKAGFGLSLCPDILAAADPEIVRCLPVEAESGREVWLLAPERVRNSPHVRKAMDFLGERLVALGKELSERLRARS